jgi:hypothetical protein
MNNQENINEIVRFFFCLQLNLKIYHWNTTSYARHIASDELGGTLLPLVDKFIEVFIGKYKVKPVLNGIKISPEYSTEEGGKKLLIHAQKYLEDLPSKVNAPEILNIKDEILGEIENTLYKFELK